MTESLDVRQTDRLRAWIAAAALSWLAIGAFVTVASANQTRAEDSPDIIRLQDKAESVDGRLHLLENLQIDHRLTQLEGLTQAINDSRKEERTLMYTVIGGVAGVLILQALGIRKERAQRGH